MKSRKIELYMNMFISNMNMNFFAYKKFISQNVFILLDFLFNDTLHNLKAVTLKLTGIETRHLDDRLNLGERGFGYIKETAMGIIEKCLMSVKKKKKRSA